MNTRRGFLTEAAAWTVTGAAALWTKSGAKGNTAEDRVRDFLKPYVLKPETLDQFFDPKAKVWAKFHPTYGYLLRNSYVRDGMDGSHTLARYEESGQRFQVNFRDQPCRINTYGDSFTQGHQVSDGETWQEVLAAHFCEPLRNFGIGGFGVYQAYRRLLDTEKTDLGAKYLIFNLWGDDHYRSIYSWRWLSFPPGILDRWDDAMFHANPWVHARLDPRTGDLIDRPNPCPDENTLRQLCDFDFVVETFGKDEVVHLMIASRTGIIADQAILDQVAKTIGGPEPDWSTEASVRTTADRLLHDYGVRVGMQIIEKTKTFADGKGKKLLVLLSYPMGSVANACKGVPPGHGTGNIDWHPAEFKQFLKSKKIPFVDTLPKHLAEFQTFKLSPQEYINRYYIGHYTPRGNHFFAYAVKDEILAWLDPKPPAYREDNEPLIRFKDYLPG